MPLSQPHPSIPDSRLAGHTQPFAALTLPADYNMHTPLCRHAVGEPRDLAAHALAVGLSEIGFSDHSPMPQDDFDDWRMRAAELDTYVGAVEAVRFEFPQLTIKLGLEVDFLPGSEAWIRHLAARHPWDYFIGSVHHVSPGWAIDNPQRLSEWKQRDPLEVWTAYFDRLTFSSSSVSGTSRRITADFPREARRWLRAPRLSW